MATGAGQLQGRHAEGFPAENELSRISQNEGAAVEVLVCVSGSRIEPRKFEYFSRTLPNFCHLVGAKRNVVDLGLLELTEEQKRQDLLRGLTGGQVAMGTTSERYNACACGSGCHVVSRGWKRCVGSR